MTQPYTAWQRWRSLSAWVHGVFLQPYRCRWCNGYHLTSERGEVEL